MLLLVILKLKPKYFYLVFYSKIDWIQRAKTTNIKYIVIEADKLNNIQNSHKVYNQSISKYYSNFKLINKFINKITKCLKT